MVKFMTNFQFLPVNGGGICLLGYVAGKLLQTTNVKMQNSSLRQVSTESGSVYQLSEPKPGVWQIQLQLKRPEEFKNIESFLKPAEGIRLDQCEQAQQDPEIEKFKAMLKNHDYYYDYSDDNKVWNRGNQERMDIMKMVDADPRCKALWEQYKKQN